MHIAYCGPISLDILTRLVSGEAQLSSGYSYPLGAYLVKAYLDKGHTVSVVTNSFAFNKPITWKSGTLTIFASPRRAPQYLILDAYLAERRMIRKHLELAQPDVIHAQWCYEFAHAALKTSIPTLTTVRDDPWTVFKHDSNPYRLYRAFYGSWLLSKLPFVTAVSPYLGRVINRKFRLRSEPKIISNGLSDDFFVTKPRECSLTKPPTFISVTEWNSRKNPKMLFKAFGEVRQRIPEARLLVIGNGLGIDEVGRAWAVRQGVEKGIQFLGRKKHEDVLDFVASADIFVHSTSEESFCMTILEAMGLGVPAIALPDSGAVPWLLGEGRAGLLAGEKSIKALADAMVHLATSPEYYKNLSANGLARVASEFCMSTVAEEFLTHLSEIKNYGS